MKTVKIEIKIVSRNDYIGGYDVLLKSNNGEIEAFINDKNYVTVNTSTYLHGLFKNPPYTSDFVKKANEEIQKGFENWDITSKEIIVNFPNSNENNYEDKRVTKRISLNSETEFKILEYANGLNDFSNNIKNQLRSSMISKIIYQNVSGFCVDVMLQKRVSLPQIEFNHTVYGCGHGIKHETTEPIKNQKIMKATEALYKKLTEATETGFTMDYVAIIFDNKLYAMTIQESKKLDVKDDTFYLSLWNNDFYDENNGMLINAIFSEHHDAEIKGKLSDFNKEMLKKYNEIIQEIKAI